MLMLANELIGAEHLVFVLPAFEVVRVVLEVRRVFAGLRRCCP